MRPQTLVPVEDYLRTSYSPDCDYVDGVLLERNVGEYDHARLQTRLAIYLGAREKQWGIRVLVEQRLQVKPTRFRVPDVCALKADEPVEQIITRPPLVCVEILSPDDRLSSLQEKIDDYLSFGTSWVWLVDPRTRRLWACTAAGMQEVKDGVLRAGAIEVPLAELFD